MGFPLPSGEGDKGRGCVLPPLPSSQTPVLCRERVPLRSCRPALPQGGAKLLVSGPLADLARSLEGKPARICDSPSPLVRGTGEGPAITPRRFSR